MYNGVSKPIGYGNWASGIHLIRAGITKESKMAALSKPIEPKDIVVGILAGILIRGTAPTLL